MNQTLCNGKFKFVDELTEEAMRISEEVDREIEEEKTDEERALDARSAAFCERARNAIFRYIEHLGHKLNDSSVGDGYFLFPMGSGSVTHFHLKGFWLKNYRFGIWLYPKRYYDYVKYDDMTEEQRTEYLKLPEHERDSREIVAEIFQQHEDHIDKFKPSASSAVVKIDKADLDDLMEWVEKKENGSLDTDAEDKLLGMSLSVRDLGYLLSFMVHHPFYHFADFFPYAGKQPSWWTDSFAFNHPILYFVKTRFMFYFSKLKSGILKWWGFRRAFNACKDLAREKCVKEVEMASFEARYPGLKTSYIYEIHIKFNRDSTISECSAAFDRHIKSTVIGKYDEFDNVAEVETITKDGCYEMDDGTTTSCAHARWLGTEEEKAQYNKLYKMYYGDSKTDAALSQFERDRVKNVQETYHTFGDFCKRYDYDPVLRMCNRIFWITDTEFDKQITVESISAEERISNKNKNKNK